MLINYKMYKDADGCMTAEFGALPSPSVVIAWFLEGDIQGVVEKIDEYIIPDYQKLMSCQEDEISGTWNETTTTFTKEGVHLFNNFAIPGKFPVEVFVPYPQFLKIIEDWRKAIVTGEVVEGTVELDL